MLDRILKSALRVGAGRDLRLIAWLIVCLGAMFCAYIARMHEVTHDLFHEMALFREALVLGSMPTKDLFAFTPTVDMSIHHEWGAGAIFYIATIGSGLGIAGLAVLKFTIVAAIWVTLYRVARMRGASPVVFACFAFAVFPVMWVGFSTIRAQLFTLLFLSIQLFMQECDARGNRTWILAWLLMLVAWLNIHAGFVVGLALAVSYTAERLAVEFWRSRSISTTLHKTWHLGLAALGAIAVLPLNPYGWQYIRYLMRAIRMPRPTIGEWQPIWHTYAPEITLSMLAVAVTMMAYALVKLSRSGRRLDQLPRLRGAAFLLLALFMTVRHLRHGSLFAVVWLAYVPAWVTRFQLGKMVKRIVVEHKDVTIRICQVVTVGCLLFSALHQAWRPSIPDEPEYSHVCYPVGAVEYLQRQGFQGNLFTPFHAGSYVSWTMHPDVRVSFDGRYEVAYKDHVMAEHDHFLSGKEGWSNFLDEYPVDAALVHKASAIFPTLQRLWHSSTESAPSGTELQRVPANLADWQAVYEDSAYIIVARREIDLPPNRSRESEPDTTTSVFSQDYAHWQRSKPRSVD